MRPRQLWQILTLAFCLMTVAVSATLWGDNQTPPNVQNRETEPEPRQPFPVPESASAEMLRELARLRAQVGESVLSGTVLEVPPEESRAEFARGLRKALGLSADQIAKQDRTKTPLEIVTTIRTHCVHLDRIASEIEELKQYDNADQLRETAKQLRLIARQFHK